MLKNCVNFCKLLSRRSVTSVGISFGPGTLLDLVYMITVYTYVVDMGRSASALSRARCDFGSATIPLGFLNMSVIQPLQSGRAHCDQKYISIECF